MSILLIAEHDHHDLRPVTLNAVSCALEINDDLHILVAGHNCTDAAGAAAAIPGVTKVLQAEDPILTHHLAETMASLVVGMAEGYSHLLAPASTFGKNLMPRVAALLNVMQVSDVMEVIDAKTFKRPIYAGNAVATVQSRDSVQVMTVRATTFEAAPTQGGAAPIEQVPGEKIPGSDAQLSEFVGEELSASDRPELTAAQIVISGGRGLQSGDNFKLLEGIADKLGAAIGASRAAVDSGFVPNDWQVGQTGKIVAPDLYIAVGISGAIQHLAGIKDAKIIVAINKDEEAPIFQIADYGLCADLFQVLPELESKL